MSARSLGIKLFAERDLEQLAGVARVRRARRLVDTIEDLYEDEWSICGTVHDGKPYLAMVHHVGDPLSCECDCTEGAPKRWCDHAVAVGLCYLGDG
jgi:uncharacterized Zn finger protein